MEVREVRYATRSLKKSPGFALAAILTLALGIGANAAIFSVLEGVVLAPLPFRDPDRVVLVLLNNLALKYPTYLSYPDFLDWQRQSRSFEQMAAFSQRGFDLTNPGPAEHLAGREVTAGFFSTLGVKPALGRNFSVEEDRFGGSPAAIISDRVWRGRFSASPAALGKVITLSGVDHAVVGILPRGFRFDEDADVYTALGHDPPLLRADRTIHDVGCVARLKPGITIGQAQAELNAVQEGIDRLNPNTERGLATFIEPLKHAIVGDVSRTLALLLGAVGLVLLIASANVANLLLARSAARTREFAVRLALGAKRAHVIRQIITECVLLSLAGGALGLVLAKWLLGIVLAAWSEALPRADNIGVNLPVLLFAFGASLIVGVLFGLLPALKSSRTDLQGSLREGGRGVAAGHRRTQGVLVVVQIALALVLLTGSSLLFRTIRNLWGVDPGFDPQHVVTFKVGLSPSLSSSAAKIRTAYQELIERIRRIPEVEAADITALVPLGRNFNEGAFWPGTRQPASFAEIPRAIYYPTGPDYVRTMRIPLLRGRYLSLADNTGSERVILIDTLLAQRYFPDRDPVGQTITVPHWGLARVAGVVGHVEHYGLDGSLAEKPEIFYSFYQLNDEWIPSFRSEVSIAARSKAGPAALMPAIKEAVYSAGGDQPVYNVRTMEELVSGSMASQRLPMFLLTAFAALALALAFVGIYGVISYTMSQRIPEVGIRMALGAVKKDVLRMVLVQGLRLAFAGVAVGAIASLVLTHVMTSFSRLLYGVRPGDPWTLIAVSTVLITTALAACYIPARRSALLDPMAALRHE